jgi:hypothetical protein
MKWAYDNNNQTRKLIQEGVLEDRPANAVKKITKGYKVGQAHNSVTYQELDRCGPIEIIRAAKAVVGI